MKNSILLLAAGVALLATSCEKEESSNVNQTRIWTGYTMAYDASQDKTSAQAQFKFGNGNGTLLRLTPPASVSVGGDTMGFLELLVYYEKQFAGLRDSITVVYRDTVGNAYTNLMTVARPISLPAGLDTISKSAAYNLVWSGASLSSSETMSLSITSTNGGNYQAFFNSAAGANNIVLDADKLQSLNTGSATVRIERQNRTEPVQHPGAGGQVTSKYVGLSKTVVIVP